jgi:hypothetical protein
MGTYMHTLSVSEKPDRFMSSVYSAVLFFAISSSTGCQRCPRVLETPQQSTQTLGAVCQSSRSTHGPLPRNDEWNNERSWSQVIGVSE